MKSLSVKEVHELAKALVAIQYTDEVRALLDGLEAESVGLENLMEELRRASGSDQARHPSSFL